MTKPFDIVTSDMPRVKLRYEKMRKNIANMAIPHKKISIFLDQWVQRNFKTEGGKVGGWAAIRREGRILQDTGRLRMSFIPFASRRNAGIGSDLPYSKKHEDGIGVKKRRILPVISEVKNEIIDRYEMHIKKAAQ